MNNSNGEEGDTDESNTEVGEIDYNSQYNMIKKKLKFLIYENEYFQEKLRENQERLLKVSRDKNFLLDRLLKYEKPLKSSSEESSSDEDNKRKFNENKPMVVKRRKLDHVASNLSDEKEAMIEKLQARNMGSEMVSLAFSTVPQELFSNEPSMDSTYGEM